MEKEIRGIEAIEGDLYDHVRENLLNELSQLQRLKEEGIDVQAMQEDVEARLRNYFEFDDARRLAKLRTQLSQQIKYPHHWTTEELENL